MVAVGYSSYAGWLICSWIRRVLARAECASIGIELAAASRIVNEIGSKDVAGECRIDNDACWTKAA